MTALVLATASALLGAADLGAQVATNLTGPWHLDARTTSASGPEVGLVQTAYVGDADLVHDGSYSFLGTVTVNSQAATIGGSITDIYVGFMVNGYKLGGTVATTAFYFSGSLNAALDTVSGTFNGYTATETQWGGTFTLTRVAPTNNPPSIGLNPNLASVDLTLGQSFTMTVTGSDTDAGQSVTLSTAGLPPGMTFSATAGNPASGTVSGAPTSLGSFTATFTATDNGVPALSSLTTVVFTVAAPPTAGPNLTGKWSLIAMVTARHGQRSHLVPGVIAGPIWITHTVGSATFSGSAFLDTQSVTLSGSVQGAQVVMHVSGLRLAGEPVIGCTMQGALSAAGDLILGTFDIALPKGTIVSGTFDLPLGVFLGPRRPCSHDPSQRVGARDIVIQLGPITVTARIQVFLDCVVIQYFVSIGGPALGTEVEVPRDHDVVQVDSPPGTNPPRSFEIRIYDRDIPDEDHRGLLQLTRDNQWGGVMKFIGVRQLSGPSWQIRTIQLCQCTQTFLQDGTVLRTDHYPPGGGMGIDGPPPPGTPAAAHQEQCAGDPAHPDYTGVYSLPQPAPGAPRVFIDHAGQPVPVDLHEPEANFTVQDVCTFNMWIFIGPAGGSLDTFATLGFLEWQTAVQYDLRAGRVVPGSIKPIPHNDPHFVRGGTDEMAQGVKALKAAVYDKGGGHTVAPEEH